jgi:hypothetical protein
MSGQSPTKPILIVWQHGDERLAPRLKRHISVYRSDLWKHVDFINGNPPAAKLHIGHIQTNLNRSFAPTAGIARSYEEKRAQYILQRIRKSNYQYVLDVHTTVTDSGRFWIVNKLNEATRTIIGQSEIERITTMEHLTGVVESSLIGAVPQAAALECNYLLARQQHITDEIIAVLDRLIANKPLMALPREVYPLDICIPNETPIERDARNFAWSTIAGGYPVLHGQNSYRAEGFQGFRAPRREIITL